MELSEYRITANDGKTLMSFHSYVDENLSEELHERVLECVQMLCKEAVEQYGQRILAQYESNADRNKRMHTLAVRCEIMVSDQAVVGKHEAKLKVVFKKGFKKLFEFEEKLCYEPKWKLFYIG